MKTNNFILKRLVDFIRFVKSSMMPMISFFILPSLRINTYKELSDPKFQNKVQRKVQNNEKMDTLGEGHVDKFLRFHLGSRSRFIYGKHILWREVEIDSFKTSEVLHYFE